jgi:hypothetical protein
LLKKKASSWHPRATHNTHNELGNKVTHLDHHPTSKEELNNKKVTEGMLYDFITHSTHQFFGELNSFQLVRLK